MRPLPLSSRTSATLSHCNTFSWPVLQLGSSYLFLAALAAIMQPLPPSCGPCHHHAAPAAIMQPLPLSCCPCRHHVTPAAIMLPMLPSVFLLPSCGPMPPSRSPLLPSSDPCHHHAAPCCRQTALAPFRTHWLDCQSSTWFFYSLSPSSPAWSTMAESGGDPCSGPKSQMSAVVNPPMSWGKIRQSPAYISQYLFCTSQSCVTFTPE
jgi:hypothetical protein